MDKFFDVLNVSNYTDGIHKRKEFKQPYRSAEDFRLKVCCSWLFQILLSLICYPQWLEEDFLGFLDEWEASVKIRPGFSKGEKMMLLSPATMLGLRITGESLPF